MKYVLRHKRTGRYRGSSGRWVHCLDDALTFSDMVDVREYCQAHQLEDAQPVQRLMPCLMSLLRDTNGTVTVGA